MHGLLALSKEDMQNEDLQKFTCDLQSSAVCDMFPPSKIEQCVEQGLSKNREEWFTLTALAGETPPPTCNVSCLRRAGDGDGLENFCCCKIHSVFEKVNPLADEWKLLKFKFYTTGMS